MGGGADQSGIILPTGVLATLEAEHAATPATPPPGSPAQLQTPPLGGVSAICIDANSYLQVQVLPSPGPSTVVPNVSLQVNTRTIDPNGSIVNNVYTFTANLAAGLTYTEPLPLGYLLSLSVNTLTPGVVTGVCFVIAGITHQLGANQLPDIPLASGYVCTLTPVGWPSGILHDVSDGEGYYGQLGPFQTSGGGTYTYTIVDQFIQLEGIRFTFGAGTTVANRWPAVSLIVPGYSALMIAMANTAVVADGVFAYWFIPQFPYVSYGLNADVVGPLAYVERISVGTQIQVTAQNFQTGDTINTIIFFCRFWS